jgi:hypothetical protein
MHLAARQATGKGTVVPNELSDGGKQATAMSIAYPEERSDEGPLPGSRR